MSMKMRNLMNLVENADPVAEAKKRVAYLEELYDDAKHEYREARDDDEIAEAKDLMERRYDKLEEARAELAKLESGSISEEAETPVDPKAAKRAKQQAAISALTDDELYDKKGAAVVSEEGARMRFAKNRSVKNGEAYQRAREKAGALRNELRSRGLPAYKTS